MYNFSCSCTEHVVQFCHNRKEMLHNHSSEYLWLKRGDITSSVQGNLRTVLEWRTKSICPFQYTHSTCRGNHQRICKNCEASGPKNCNYSYVYGWPSDRMANSHSLIKSTRKELKKLPFVMSYCSKFPCGLVFCGGECDPSQIQGAADKDLVLSYEENAEVCDMLRSLYRCVFLHWNIHCIA